MTTRRPLLSAAAIASLQATRNALGSTCHDIIRASRVVQSILHWSDEKQKVHKEEQKSMTTKDKETRGYSKTVHSSSRLRTTSFTWLSGSCSSFDSSVTDLITVTVFFVSSVEQTWGRGKDENQDTR